MNSFDQSIWGEVIKFGAQAIMVIVGWFVVNRLSISREKEKGRRDIVAQTVEALCDLNVKLLEDARKYHMSNRDKSLELTLRMELQDFAFQIVGLKKIASEAGRIASCLEKNIELRKSITGYHFDDEHDGPLDAHAELLNDLAAAHLAMKKELVALRYAQFH